MTDQSDDESPKPTTDSESRPKRRSIYKIDFHKEKQHRSRRKGKVYLGNPKKKPTPPKPFDPNRTIQEIVEEYRATQQRLKTHESKGLRRKLDRLIRELRSREHELRAIKSGLNIKERVGHRKVPRTNSPDETIGDRP